jgi:glycosyltransferase 2 family protein
MLTTVTEDSHEISIGPAQAAARRRFFIACAKIAFTALAIGWVALTVDLSAAWQRMQQQVFWIAALAAGLILLQIALGALRWHLILRQLGARVAFPDSARLFYIGAFFNVYLWGAVAGDALRGWLIYRAQANAATAVGSVVLDRVASVVAAALLVLATAPLFGERAGFIFAAILAAVAAGLLGGILLAAQVHRLPLDWQRSALPRGVEMLSRATATVFLRPTAIATLVVAIGAQIALALVVHALAASLGIDVGLVDCVLLMQPVALIAALPVSVGGWGAREAAMIGLFGLIGVPASAALALSVQLGLLNILMTLPGGVLWLLTRDRCAHGRREGAK